MTHHRRKVLRLVTAALSDTETLTANQLSELKASLPTYRDLAIAFQGAADECNKDIKRISKDIGSYCRRRKHPDAARLQGLVSVHRDLLQCKALMQPRPHEDKLLQEARRAVYGVSLAAIIDQRAGRSSFWATFSEASEIQFARDLSLLALDKTIAKLPTRFTARFARQRTALKFKPPQPAYFATLGLRG